MTKKIIFTLLALVLTTATFAQSGRSAKEIRQENFIYGPKVGLSMPYQHLVTNTTDLKSLLGGPNAGIQLGGYMRGMLPLKKINIVLYAQLEAAWDMNFYFGGNSSASAGYFNFPLVIGGGYKLDNGMTLRLAGGPTYTVNIYDTANTAFKDVDNDYQNAVKDMLSRDPWGWAVDLGVDYKSWNVDLRYMNQFRSKDIFRVADEYRFISIGLSVGYKF